MLLNFVYNSLGILTSFTNTILVIKVACVSTAFILFNEYFYGDFPPSEKVIDDKQVDEGTIVKYDRLLENLLVILLSLSLLFIM